MITLGKITSVFGIKGWVKVYSYTEPMEQILSYPEWTLKQADRNIKIRIASGKVHGKGLIALIEGCSDRDSALQYQGSEISVDEDQLPDLSDGEYYWHQLQGLRVITLGGEDLGAVDHLMSAGSANDVLVVKGDQQSCDRQERLIPYLPDNVVTEVDLDAGVLRVDWQPDY